MRPAQVHTAAGKSPELVSLIYEAAAGASLWPAFLDAYAEAVSGRRAALVLGTGHGNGAAPFHWSIWPDEDVRLRNDRRIAEDWCRTVGEGQPEGAIWTMDLEQSPAYPEFHAPRDVRYGIAGVFLRTADAPSMIVAVRGEQDGPLGEPAFAILSRLMPHLRQAALLQREVTSLRATRWRRLPAIWTAPRFHSSSPMREATSSMPMPQHTRSLAGRTGLPSRPASSRSCRWNPGRV